MSSPPAPQISKAKEITVQFSYTSIQAQAIPLTLQGSASSLTSLTLAGAQREREGERETAERSSTN